MILEWTDNASLDYWSGYVVEVTLTNGETVDIYFDGFRDQTLHGYRYDAEVEAKGEAVSWPEDEVAKLLIY